MRSKLLLATCLTLSSITTWAQSAPTTVQTTTPERRDVERSATFPATVTAWQEVAILPRVSGEVKDIKVDIGDTVKKDQVLLVIDNPELAALVVSAQADVMESSATLKQARAEELAAQADLEAGQRAVRLGAEQTKRLLSLQKAQSATAREAEEAQKYHIEAQANIEQATARLEVARVKVQVAEARLQSMHAKLEQTKVQQQFLEVKAPFDGVITDRAIDTGAIVSPTTNFGPSRGLVVMQDNSRMRIVVDVPETEAPAAKPGTKVEISVGALGPDKIKGQITRTAGSLAKNVKTLRVEVDVENKDQKLIDGMFAHASIVLDTQKDVLSVPAKAVATKGGNSSVLLVVDGKVKFNPIKIGISSGKFTQVVEGLTPNDAVIVSARDALGTGMEVKAEPAPEVAATQPAPAAVSTVVAAGAGK